MSSSPDKPGILQRLIGALHWLEDGLLVSLVLAMTLLAFGQILMRNFLGTGSIIIDPLLRVMVLWVGLIGALVATRLDKQISIDVLTRMLSPRLVEASHIVTRLFAATIAGLIAWHAARFLIDEWHIGTVAFAKVPAWAAESIIPVGFAVIALRYLLQGLAAVPRVIRPSALDE
jgi:TRAP-type C4-dicarboxylate transport system permease small subunit